MQQLSSVEHNFKTYNSLFGIINFDNEKQIKYQIYILFIENYQNDIIEILKNPNISKQLILFILETASTNMSFLKIYLTILCNKDKVKHLAELQLDKNEIKEIVRWAFGNDNYYLLHCLTFYMIFHKVSVEYYALYNFYFKEAICRNKEKIFEYLLRQSHSKHVLTHDLILETLKSEKENLFYILIKYLTHPSLGENQDILSKILVWIIERDNSNLFTIFTSYVQMDSLNMLGEACRVGALGIFCEIVSRIKYDSISEEYRKIIEELCIRGEIKSIDLEKKTKYRAIYGMLTMNFLI